MDIQEKAVPSIGAIRIIRSNPMKKLFFLIVFALAGCSSDRKCSENSPFYLKGTHYDCQTLDKD